MAVKTIDDGKFKIQSVGPVKTGVAKNSGKPWKVYSLQFEGDGQWYDCFWTSKEDPAVGAELSGKKEYDDEYNSYKFNMGFAGAKANWNPSGANATVLCAAVNLVHDFLTLDPSYLKEWQAKKGEKQSPSAYYVQTVVAIAKELKTEVAGMGGDAVQKGSTNESSKGDGDPGPTAPGVENWTEEGEENVDLGPM